MNGSSTPVDLFPFDYQRHVAIYMKMVDWIQFDSTQ